MRKSVPIAMYGLAALLTALVGYLGKVQWDEYRALENYEHVRLARVIGLSGWHLKEVFDLELEGLIESATIPGGTPAELAAQLDARLESWRTGSRWPEVIRSTYLVSGAETAPSLELFDLEAGTLRSIEWSDEVASLSAMVAPLLTADTRFPDGHGAGRHAIPAIPALLAPTAVQRQTDAPLERAWIAVRLDQDFFQQRLLPELVSTFYAPPNFHDVQIAVAESDTGQVVFSTLEVQVIEDFGRADVAYGLLDSGSDGAELPRLGMRPPSGEEAPPNWDRPPTESDHEWFRSFWARLFYSGHWQIYIRRDGVSVADKAALGLQRDMLATLAVLAALCAAIVLIVVLARRAQRMASQQLEFVASVSHELRTPLAVLSVAGENLTDSIVSDAEGIRRYGDVIQRETRRLRGTIDNVLHLARQKAGAQSTERVPVDLDRVVREGLEAHYEELEAAGIAVEHRRSQHPATVQGDVRALESAIGNLISNAVKYARGGGWLAVSVTHEEPSSGEAEVRVVIEDRGPGLEPKERRKLFDPFFRGRAASDAQAKGSGLGLAVVADVAQSHGGRVTCANRSEGGARFTLHLPTEASA